MLIKKIRITNFRQFMKTTEFEFPEGDKNVTLIVADNGAGKTTLSQAFLWCLYGETSFKNSNLLNSKSLGIMITGGEDMVKVSMDIEQNNIVYTITRSEIYTKKSNGAAKVLKHDFHVSYVEIGGNTAFMTAVQSEVFVKKLLPKELSSFFFFGGEKIESMSKEIEAGKSAQFKDAVNGLAGLTATLAAIKHFKPTVKDSVYGRLKNEVDDSGAVSLKAYLQEIQSNQFKIAENNKRIDEIGPQISDYTDKQEDVQKKINDMLAAEKVENNIKELEENISRNNDSKIDNINSLLSYFSTNTASHFSLPLIHAALKSLQGAGKMDQGIPDMRDTTVKFLLKRGYCICGQKLEVGDNAYKNVMDLIEVLPPKNLGQLIGEFATHSRSKANNNKDYLEQIETLFANVRRLDEENEKMECSRQLLMETATDTSEGKLFRQRLKEYGCTIRKLDEERIRAVIANENLEKDISRIETEKTRLNQISQKNEHILLYMEYAKATFDHFQSDYNTRSEEVRNELERRINKFLIDIFGGSITISIDRNYNIISHISGSQIVEGKTELEKSTAQGYAIIFAFISALIEMAKEKAKEDIMNYQEQLDLDVKPEDAIEFQDAFPLVMDAPLSVFDKTRIKHLCEILPTIADQVIFFIKDTDGNVAEEYLGDSVGAKYVLSKDVVESVTTSERIL